MSQDHDTRPVAEYLRRMAPAAPSVDGDPHLARRQFLNAADFLGGLDIKPSDTSSIAVGTVVVAVPIYYGDQLIGWAETYIDWVNSAPSDEAPVPVVTGSFSPHDNSGDNSTTKEQ